MNENIMGTVCREYNTPTEKLVITVTLDNNRKLSITVNGVTIDPMHRYLKKYTVALEKYIAEMLYPKFDNYKGKLSTYMNNIGEEIEFYS